MSNKNSPENDVIITAQDFQSIKSVAKDRYVMMSADKYLSNKKVEQNDIANLAIVESVIMWLNNNGLLNNLARFDFTDHSSELESYEEQQGE